MAGSFTFQELVIAASDVSTRALENSLAPVACNMALNEVWRRHDWRESLADFPPFYLVPLVQDYGPPVSGVPTDFLGLRRAYYINLSAGNEVPYTKELTCPGDLPASADPQEPESLCYYESTRKFRVHPLVPPSYGSPYHLIEGKYKKKPAITIKSDATVTLTKITAQYLNDALIPFNDLYLTMWIEAVKWALMDLAGNPKAGGVQLQNGVEAYYGQYATMMAAIGQMADTEAGEIGPAPAHPQRSLIRSTTFW